MPKMIENLHQRLLVDAKETLLGQGYDKLTIRGVAARCQVAVGTVYNYYPSKETLVASVMLADWQQKLARMREETAKATCALDGLNGIAVHISAFVDTYSGVFAQYTTHTDARPILRERHHLLIEQLNEIVEPLLARFDCLFHPALIPFMAETLLMVSVNRSTSLEDLRPILQKLLQ